MSRKLLALGVPWEDAFDDQIIQKILPRIKGTDIRLGAMLQRLNDVTANRFPRAIVRFSISIMVFTPMESSPSSKLKFFDETRAVIPLPVEGSKCGIAIDVPQESWSDISLQFGTQSLVVFFDKKEKRAFCEWPLCGPGHYDLYLVCRDYRERRKITLMPRYFTESEVSSVLDELTETLPKSIALQLLECGAPLGTLAHKSSVEEEYLELSRALNGTTERLGLCSFCRSFNANVTMC